MLLAWMGCCCLSLDCWTCNVSFRFVLGESTRRLSWVSADILSPFLKEHHDVLAHSFRGWVDRPRVSRCTMTGIEPRTYGKGYGCPSELSSRPRLPQGVVHLQGWRVFLHGFGNIYICMLVHYLVDLRPREEASAPVGPVRMSRGIRTLQRPERFLMQRKQHQQRLFWYTLRLQPKCGFCSIGGISRDFLVSSLLTQLTGCRASQN